MSKFQFNRDNILSPQERLDSARKCLRILEEIPDQLTDWEQKFVGDMTEKAERYGVSERQLKILRDTVSKYV